MFVENAVGDKIFTSTEIHQAICNLADELNLHFKDQELTVLCVMTGALVFCGHLLPRLKMPITLDYVHASRYGDSNTGADLNWIYRPDVATLSNKTVLIVDDLCDEGITLNEIKHYCLQSGAAKASIAVLCDKQKSAPIGLQPDFVGLQSDDKFLIGFGLDSQGRWRNLPDIHELNNG